MNITLRQIESFFYAAKLGSLSLAAERLNITQAAASMALRDFENQLGEQLFERIGKKLALNESGRTVLALAAEIIGRSQELEYAFSGKKGYRCEHLTLGASSTVGNYIIPGYVADFINTNCIGNLHLQVGNTNEIIDKVLKYEVDLGIVEGLCYEPMIETTPWLDDELSVFCAADNPLADKDEVSIEDMEKYPWILREDGSGTRTIFENQVNLLSMHLNVSIVLGHTEAIKNAVSKSMAISCLSNCALKDMADLGRIKLLNTPSLNLKHKLYVLIHKEKFHTKIVKRFLEKINASL